MVINTIYIARFQQWHHYKIDLDNGWTNIYGGNESGKTTLSLFIQSILFGFKDANRLLHLSDDSGGYLIVTMNQQTYRLERYMHQNRGKVSVILEETGEIVGGEEMLTEQLGMSLKDYKAIYYFQPFLMSQQKMTEEEWQSYALSYATTGNDILFQQEKHYQKEARRYKNNRMHQGKLTQLLMKKKQLEQRIADMEQNEQKQHMVTQAQYEQLVSQKVQLETMIKQKEEYESLQHSDIDILSSKEEAYIEDLIDEWEAESDGKISQDEWEQLTTKYKYLQELVAQYIQEKEVSSMPNQHLALMIYGIILFIFFIGIYMLFNHHLLIGLFLIVMGLISLCYAQKMIRYINKKYNSDLSYRIEKVIQSFEPYIICQATSLNEQLVDIRQQMHQLKKEVVTHNNVHHIQEKLQQYTFINATTLFLAKQSIAEYYSKKRQYEKDRKYQAQLKEQISPLLNRSAEDINTEYHRITKEVNDAFYILQQESSIDLPTLYQRLATLDDEIEMESIRYIQNQLKLNWVNDIKDEQQQLLLPQVLQRGSLYFSLLTNHRYTTIFFKENQLYVRGKKNYQMTDLSQGSQLQLMMALRLAFIMSQTKIKLPIIMDEGWAFFDMERSEALFYLLQTCSAEQQIITFSHYSLADYCHKEISL